MDREIKQLGIDQSLLTKLKDCGIINLKGELFYIGNSWFKDTQTGCCYKVSLIDNHFKVIETRQSRAKSSLRIKKLRYEFTDIQCQDCGTTRRIRSADKHLVKRCKPCQLKIIAKRRKERNLRKRENVNR